MKKKRVVLAAIGFVVLLTGLVVALLLNPGRQGEHSSETKQVVPSRISRPAWYPFKHKPDGAVAIPRGDVVLTAEEAKSAYLRIFDGLARELLEDPDTPSYIVRRVQEFVGHSHASAHLLIVAGRGYSQPNGTSAATTFAPQEHPEKPVIQFFMPLWVEQDHWFVREYTRAQFGIVVSHEMEHFHEGFWRPEREHSPQENARTEAIVWSITCEQAVLPLVRRQVLLGHEYAVCNEWVRLGRQLDAPAFVDYVARYHSHIP